MGGVDGFLNGGYVFNTDIALLLMQILIITILSRAIGALIRLIKEPTVIAELLAGIILGPTVLGRIPNFTDTIFPDSSLPMLNIVAQLGLILYMFVVGLEIDIKSMKEQLKTSVAVAIIGVAVPLVFALGLSFILYDPDLVQPDINRGVFFLFLGVIFGTSALPVLARILSEYRLMSVRLGIFTMGVTTVDDLIGWPLLALTMAISGATSFLSLVWIFLALITFALILAFPVRFLLHFVGRKTRHQEVYSQTTIFFVLTIMFTMAWVAEIIGLSAIVGAFLVGICVPRFVNLPHQLVERIEDLVTVVFLPLFFTIIGLNTRLGLLDTGTVWGYVILCTFAAIISKGIGEGLPARFLGKFSWTESAVFGVLMSAKGLVALIILNLGITHNIITERLFAILVVAVLVNTMLVSPLVALVFRIGGNPYTAASPQFMNPNEEAINVMVCTNYSLTAPLMVSLAQSLVNYKQKTVPKVFVTRLFEASNRPSDLVSASNPDKAKKNDDVIIAAAQRAKMLRLDVAEVISRMSSNYGEDIATEAVQRGVDLIVMGSKKTTLRGTTMNKVISKCSSNVAVVLQRSLTGALKIDSILFVYKSGAHDELALDYALKIVEARQARLAVIKIEQEEDARSSSILQRLFRKNKIEFRTVKTDEELQNALDVEVKNHLYSIAMTGWESPAIPLLLTLDETLPLVAVYANKNKEHAPVQVDVSTTDSQPNSKNFVLDEEEDMDSADNAPSNNNAQEGSSMEESVNNSEELIVIENKPIKKKQKQVDEYVKLEDIE